MGKYKLPFLVLEAMAPFCDTLDGERFRIRVRGAGSGVALTPAIFLQLACYAGTLVLPYVARSVDANVGGDWLHLLLLSMAPLFTLFVMPPSRTTKLTLQHWWFATLCFVGTFVSLPYTPHSAFGALLTQTGALAAALLALAVLCGVAHGVLQQAHGQLRLEQATLAALVLLLFAELPAKWPAQVFYFECLVYLLVSNVVSRLTAVLLDASHNSALTASVLRVDAVAANLFVRQLQSWDNLGTLLGAPVVLYASRALA